MNSSLKIKLVSTIVIGTALAASASAAQEATRLRLADSLPAGHFLTKSATAYFIEEVTRQLNGAVKIEHYPAEQLGKAKDIIALTQSGVVDIGYAPVAAVADKMPLSAVAELPGTFTSSCEGTLAFWALAKSGGLLDAKEFGPQGLRVLYAYANPPFQLFGRGASMSTPDAFAGTKVRAVGNAQTLTVRAMGGVPVAMSPAEAYENISRGVVDGVIFPVPSVFSYDVQNVVKTYSKDFNFGSSAGVYVISEKKWQALPQPLRDAMTAAGDEATMRGCKRADDDAAAGYQKFEAMKLTRITATPEQTAKLGQALEQVTQEWLERVKAQGKPADDVLKAFRDELDK